MFFALLFSECLKFSPFQVTPVIFAQGNQSSHRAIIGRLLAHATAWMIRSYWQFKPNSVANELVAKTIYLPNPGSLTRPPLSKPATQKKRSGIGHF